MMVIFQPQGNPIRTAPNLLRQDSSQPTQAQKPSLEFAKPFPTSAPLFRGTVHDTVTLSKKTANSSSEQTAEQRKATQTVDALLNQCDQQSQLERMSLRDFLIKASLEPQRYLPTTSAYVLDAFQHYDGPNGPEKIRVYGETQPQFKMMSAPWSKHLSQPVRLYGQEPTVKRVWDIIRTFKQQPNVDRGIVLFGPHGSGKSIIPKTLMAGLEHFSRQEEGALWTYSFVFPDGKTIQAQPEDEANRWRESVNEKNRLLDADKIAAQLMANLHLNPLFLLAPQQRIAFLNTLKSEGKIPKDFNIDYYLKSNLDSHSQNILNQLQQFYSEHPQRFQKALEHIQVERWTLSAQDFRGLVEVPASKNPDALLREVPGKSALGNAPERLRSMPQRTIEGLMPRAHRGIFYLDDYGRDGRTYDHLLMPLETNEVILQEVNGGPAISKELLDFIPMLSVNPEILEKKRAEGDFEALEQRMLFVPVPFERRYGIEAQILAPIIQRATAQGKRITPQTLDAFAQWVTLTRLFPSDKTNKTYQDISTSNKAFASGIAKLTPLGKALLYQGEKADNLSSAEFEALDKHLNNIAQEHNHSLGETEFSLYEGGVGLSNRAAANLLKQLTTKTGEAPISFLDSFECIARFIQTKPQYEQKRAEILKNKGRTMQFPSGKALLREVEDHTRALWMRQLRTALGVYQEPAAYVNRIQQYAEHVEALRNGRMVTEPYRIDGDPAPRPDLLETFETAINGDKKMSQAEQTTYRALFSARSIDWDQEQSPSENIQNLYNTELEQLKKADELTHQKILTEFREHLKNLQRAPKSQPYTMAHTTTGRFEEALNQLNDSGYPTETLPRLMDWALKNEYISDAIREGKF